MPEQIKAKHNDPACKGYSQSFHAHPTAAIARMLRVESAGFHSLTPIMVGASAKLLVFSPDCADCQTFAQKEIQRRLLLRTWDRV